MRRLEVERIDEVPAATPVIWRIPGEPGIRRGWGRRCGLGAADQARQPPSMACGASRRSGVAPARRAPHARHPGGVGVPPGWVLRPACEELADGGANAPAKRGPTPVLVSREARAIVTSGAPRGERVVHSARAAQAASGCACRRSAPLNFSGSTRKGQARCPGCTPPGGEALRAVFVHCRSRESGDPEQKKKSGCPLSRAGTERPVLSSQIGG
jgi:hypothetical protein